MSDRSEQVIKQLMARQLGIFVKINALKPPQTLWQIIRFASTGVDD
jgi:hypothetical protein